MHLCRPGSVVQQSLRDDPQEDAQHHVEHRSIALHEVTQPLRERQHPLAHRQAGENMIRQLCSGLRHAPGPAPGAKATALAAESQQLVVAATLAAQAQKAVGQDAASEEGVELFLDELRQVGVGSVFGLDEERRGMLLHRHATECVSIRRP